MSRLPTYFFENTLIRNKRQPKNVEPPWVNLPPVDFAVPPYPFHAMRCLSPLSPPNNQLANLEKS
jgi:hypothetical protein